MNHAFVHITTHGADVAAHVWIVPDETVARFESVLLTTAKCGSYALPMECHRWSGMFGDRGSAIHNATVAALFEKRIAEGAK